MIDGGKRCGCDSGHETFGECVRAKSLRVAYCQSWNRRDFTSQKRADAELQAYRDARRQGVQPPTTKLRDIRKALDISDQTGTAYQAAS